MRSTQSQPTVGPIAQRLAQLQKNEHQPLRSSSPPQKPSQMQQLPRHVSGSIIREWLNVLGVFLVPLMIGIYTMTYNSQQNSITEVNRQADLRQQESQQREQQDQQRETVLNIYLHNITDLILSRGLRTSKPRDEVRVVAQAQTFVALRQLDGMRKGIAMQFLSEATLVNDPTEKLGPVISLEDTDLSKLDLTGALLRGIKLPSINFFFRTDLRGSDLGAANLSEANLRGANLNGASFAFATLNNANLSVADLGRSLFGFANLTGANLRDADMRGADLNDANLIGADMRGADLNNADLDRAHVTSQQLSQVKSLKNTIMPNGSRHP